MFTSAKLQYPKGHTALLFVEPYNEPVRRR